MKEVLDTVCNLLACKNERNMKWSLENIQLNKIKLYINYYEIAKDL